MCTGVEIALIGAAGIGTGVAVHGQSQQLKAAKRGEEAKARLEAIRTKRERTQQIREARIRRAEILQQGANAGVSESSSVQSGASGVYGQAFSNIQYLNQQESAGKAISSARQDEINAQGIQALGKGITDIAMIGMQANSVFTNTTPTTGTKKPGTVFDIVEEIPY